MFDIANKVALVTGGAGGIGLGTAEQLLINGAKGVTLADIDEKLGEESLKKLQQKYGKDKVIFVRTDVTNKSSYENAFQRTVKNFNNVDILINNAGIFDDKNYEKEIMVNIVGVVHGISLGMDKYIPKYKSQSEGVIVNTASIAAVQLFHQTPIYSSTKSAVATLTHCFGHPDHYERTKVRVIGIAPGWTVTSIMDSVSSNPFNEACGALLEEALNKKISQPIEFVAKSMMKIIREKPSGTIWVSEEKKDIYQYNPARTPIC